MGQEISLETLAKLCEAHRAQNAREAKEIKDLLRGFNGRIRQNEKDIAGMKTWMGLIGGLSGVVGVAVALLEVLK